MADVLERVESIAPDYGIDPIPRPDRTLSGLDLAILWGDLGVGLLVLVTGALLVPALSLGAALTAIVVGSVIGVALLGVAAAAGARHGVPTMVLFRPVLGIQGSWFPSALNFLQMVGWTAVELWAMSFVADIVSERIFGFSARPLWLAIVALACTLLALWGPVGVTRVWLRNFGAWVVLGICVVLSVLVLSSGALGEAVERAGVGGWPTFGLAVDLVIAMPISWLPLVADYTRFGRDARAAGWGTALGYLVANVWLYALGALLVLTSGEAPEPAGIALGVIALAGGTFAGVIFLVGVLVGETDEAFADLYSGAVTLQNIWPKASRRMLTVAIAAVATVLAAVLTMQLYESFLFLIGSVFIPLFGILALDLFRSRRHAIASFDEGDLLRGVRWRAFVPWVAGFAVYHWIAPSGPDWWLESVTGLLGAPLSERWAWLGASVPSFAVAFVLAAALLPSRLSSEPPITRSAGT
ncbi:MAG: purine-cytosine permease family protein [Actinomycetota bacterium]